MKARLLSIGVATLVLLGLLTPSVGAQGDTTTGEITFHNYFPGSPNYRRVKAALDARPPVGLPGPLEVASPMAPVASPNWQGQSARFVSPSDATGAIGPTEYIELVNQSIGVYSRAGALMSQNSEFGFTGSIRASGDGEVMWDNNQSRFFYSMLYINGSTDNELLFGFSKGPSPSAAAPDWCSYHSTFGTYGSDFPDYPKLGITNDFMLIGVNRFDSSGITYKGSDVAWVAKPPSGVITTCPSLTSFLLGVQIGLKNGDGSNAFTPVPGNNADPLGVGYVVASHDVSGGGSASSLSLFSVTKNGVTGAAQFSGPTTVNVAPYAMPPSAPQKGTLDRLDTLDGRLTNAVTAIDPVNSGNLGLWTQHTVAASQGGLGAEVRWYEINPANGALIQSGVIHNPFFYIFVGAISPDRNGAAGLFGGNMVLGFSVSSTFVFPLVGMVSKIGANPQSTPVLVAASPKADTDFTCGGSMVPCRWGDYAGASPDPASSATGTKGMVWLSVMREGSGIVNPNWTTQNFGVVP